MNKQQFIISQLEPYFLDTSICGYDNRTESSVYISKDGNTCVIGKNMIKPSRFDNTQYIDEILFSVCHDQDKIFKQESSYKLSSNEWSILQDIHDSLLQVAFGANKDISLLPKLTLMECVANVDLSQLKKSI